MTMLKKNIILLSSSILLLGCISACVPNIAPDVDQSSNANVAMNTLHGTIVSMRPVTIKGDDNKVGMLAGGATGAVAGSAIGGGDRMHLLGAIGGAVIGGLVGEGVQDKLSKQQGMEYVVRLDDASIKTVHFDQANQDISVTKASKGRLITVVQSVGNEALSVGQKVYVIEGEHTRIVPAN